MPENTEYISHDITLRAAIARTGEHPGSVAQRIDDFTAQMTRHLGVTDWEAPLAGKWEGDLQTKMNTAMRMARDVLDMDAGERGLNMTLTATHGDHDITAIFTHAPAIGTTVPLNYVTVRIANGDPSKQVTLDDAFLMIQILVATFEPQVASVTSTELALHSTTPTGLAAPHRLPRLAPPEHRHPHPARRRPPPRHLTLDRRDTPLCRPDPHRTKHRHHPHRLLHHQQHHRDPPRVKPGDSPSRKSG